MVRALGLGTGLPFGGKRPLTGAQAMLGSEANGMAWNWVDNTSVIRKAGVDLKGTANQFLTVVGTLTPGVDGATFDASNNASFLLSSQTVDPTAYRATCTMYAEYRPDTVDATVHVTAEFCDNTTADFQRIVGSNASNQSVFTGNVGSVAQYTLTGGGAWTVVAGTWYIIAGTAAANDSAAYRSGNGPSQDATVLVMTTADRIFFGKAAGGNAFGGKIRRLALIPRRVPNASLLAVSNGAMLP